MSKPGSLTDNLSTQPPNTEAIRKGSASVLLQSDPLKDNGRNNSLGDKPKRKNSDPLLESSKDKPKATMDDDVLDRLRNQENKLESTEVRKRQKTCYVKDLNKEELPTFNLKYVPSKRPTISELIKMHEKDESLNKYKKSLLGDLDENSMKKDEPAEVEVRMIEIVCPNRPGGNIILDFMKKENGKSLFDKKENKYVIKEGSIYNIRAHIKVNFNIVLGLKYVNVVKKFGFQVDKHEEAMGTFAPQKQVQIVELSPEEAPTGMFSRGKYTGKAMFIDADGLVHMQYEYMFKIDSKW